MVVSSYFMGDLGSHPARGAWIEIVRVGHFLGGDAVAPRKGCVD